MRRVRISSRTMRIARFAGPTIAVAVACGAASAWADPPTITEVSPTAVRPGATVQVRVKGTNLADSPVLRPSFAADAKPASDAKPAAAEAVFSVTVPANQPVGLFGVRVLTNQGVSALRPFLVDDLPSVARDASNSLPEKAQKLTVPTAVDGTLEALGRHYYLFPLGMNQKVSIEVLAKRMGSTLDPVVRLFDPQGREVAWSDDEPGLQGDSSLSYTAKAAGEHRLELRDIRYQGGANAYYRLRIGDFPRVTCTHPLGVRRGAQVALQPVGADVDGVAPVTATAPTDPTVAWWPVGFKRAGGASSGFALVAVGDREEFSETEPNDAAAQANPVPPGAEINGRFATPGDVDSYRFSAKKGEAVQITGVTRRHGSPTDLVLRVLDEKGAKLSEVDDAGTEEGTLAFNPPTDGFFVLQVQDLLGRGDSTQAYRVQFGTAGPGFSVSLAEDRANVPAGGVAVLTVAASRGTYKGPIEVVAVNPPAGVTVRPALIAAQSGNTPSPAVSMTIEGAGNLKPGQPLALRLVGREPGGKPEASAPVTIADALKAGLNGMRYIPANLQSEFQAVVAPAPPYAFEPATTEVAVVPGLSAKVPVKLVRNGEFAEAVAVVAPTNKTGLPANVTATVPTIAKDQTAGEIVFAAADQAPLGDVTLVVTATAKQGNATLTAALPLLRLKIERAFQIALDAKEAKLPPSGDATFDVKVARHPSFEGPVTITVENLPAGATAEAVTIAPDATQAKVTIKTTGKTPAGAVGKPLKFTASGMAGKAKATTSAEVPANIAAP